MRRLLVAGVAVAVLLLPVVGQAGEGAGVPGGAGVVTPDDLSLLGGVRMAAYGSEAATLSSRVAESHSSPVRAGVLRVPEDYGTIVAAITAAEAGDVVEISAGYYEERTLRITKPITLRGEAGAAETIVSKSGGPLENMLLVTATSGTVVVEGLTLRGSVSNWYVRVNAPGATIRFLDCVIDKAQGATWNPTIAVQAGSFDFAGNVVMGTPKQAALSVDSVAGEVVQIRGNLFLHNSGYAVSVRGGGSISIEGNRVYGGFPLTAPVAGEMTMWNRKSGIGVSPGGEATVVNNLVVVGAEGVALSVTPAATATRVEVLHNTLVQVADGAVLPSPSAVALSGSQDSIVFRSNLVVGYEQALACSESGSPDVAYNDLVDSSGIIVGCEEAGVGTNLAMPVDFPGPEFGSYELPAGSAVVDAADPASPVVVDLAGRARPQDGDGDGTARADIGAYESTTPAFGFISGTVVDSNPGDPIASECVYAVDAGTGALAAVTIGSADPDPYDEIPEGGAYALGPLPTGAYRLRFVDCNYRGVPDWWYADTLHPDGLEVALDAGAGVSGLNLSVPVPSTLVVSAVGVNVCGQLYTPDGYLVASTEGARPWVIADIPAALYTLLVWDCRTGQQYSSFAYEFWEDQAHFDAADPVSVEAFNQNNHVTVAFEGSTWVLGKVTNAQGKPVEGILAIALDRTGFGLFGGYSDADGIYAIPGMRLDTSGFRMIFWDPQGRYGPQFLGGALTFETSTVFSIQIAPGQTYPWVPDMALGPGLRCHGRLPTIIGFDTADTMVGTTAADVIAAQGGDDLVSGGGGNDTICGGSGNDFVWGGAGRDVIDGGLGRDRLFGEGGNDTIYGGAGRDRLVGGPGTDTLDGGPGTDVCQSGETLNSCP